MASTSNSNLPAEEYRNWLELPVDLMAVILHRVGAVEILRSAQKVCTTWRRICKDPAMWRVIDMHDSGYPWNMSPILENMAKHAIDLSCGYLVDLNIEYFGSDILLQYISDRCSQLRRLQLISCPSISSEGLSQAVKKLPSLEELHLYYISVSKQVIEDTGRSCPLLKSLKLNNKGVRFSHMDCDDEALAIAENMPELRHLQLFGNLMTNNGLQAILDKCLHLESLDIRHCFNVALGGHLGKRCSEQIKDLRRPYDSTEDYEFNTEVHDYDSFDEEYPSGLSDIEFVSDADEYLDFSGGSDFGDYGSDYDRSFDD